MKEGGGKKRERQGHMMKRHVRFIPESVRFHQSSVSFLRRPKLRLDYKRHEIFNETCLFLFSSSTLVTGILHRYVYGTARKQVKDTRPYKDSSLIVLFLFSLLL